MKFIINSFTFLLLGSLVAGGQDPDSLRRIIKGMNFEVPVLSPVPSMVPGVEKASISLNGTWEFNPGDKDPGSAVKIEVPGEWEMQGLKVEKGRSATYRKTFTLPSDWKNNRVRIRFDGVSSYGLVRINGKTIGSHEGSFAPFEFDITDAVIPGENILEVEVQCETVSDLLACTSQYAAHPVGGILRKVTLYTLPQINLSDFSWDVKFDKQYRDAILDFTARVIFNRKAGKRSEIYLVLDIRDADGKPVKPERYTFHVPVSGSVSEVRGLSDVPSPKKWDPEHPYLYQLIVSLVIDGKIVQTNIHKAGFREIELRDNQMFVNDRPVKLRGVNRHEVHPLRGRSLTPELCRRDVELFRAANCNYIRTSHYPPSEEFLQACDELGMFVESEASLCWIQHGASPVWQTWNYLDTQYLPHMVRANQDNVLAGRNHPCIIIWSLGNESRWSPLWERVLEEVKKLDPLRPTAFHDQCWGAYNNATSKADIANYHYPGFNGPRECEKEKNRPTLFGEYMHVQCYARRELETDPGVRSDVYANTLNQMVDSVYLYPACLGGAIWSGIDDIFHISESKICGYGPWGPVDGWRREKPEYTGMKNSYTPVKILSPEKIKISDNKLILNIENRYNFTNLKELKTVVKAGNEIFSVSADIAPLTKGSLILDLPDNCRGEKILISFSDPRGFICHEEIITAGITATPEGPAATVKLSLKEDAGNYIIESGPNIFRFDKQKGTLSCNSDGDEIITRGGEFMLVYFNNDDGGAPNIANNGYTQDIRPLEYGPVTNYKPLKINALVESDGSVHVNVTGIVENIIGGKQAYVFTSSGTMQVSYDYVALADFKGKDRLRQFGILFTFPRSFDKLNWERKGLWTSYPGNDISRIEGSASASQRDLEYVEEPRVVQSGSWKDNANKLGTNDFRSTKGNIIRASLTNNKNREGTVRSDGTQSARAWVDGENIRFLIAGMNGPGSCGFFTGPRPEFNAGDHLMGDFVFQLK